MSNVLLLALGASAAVCPPAAIAKLAPLAASAPTFLALMGIYRVAQRPLARAFGYAMAGLRSWAKDAAASVFEATDAVFARQLAQASHAHSA